MFKVVYDDTMNKKILLICLAILTFGISGCEVYTSGVRVVYDAPVPVYVPNLYNYNYGYNYNYRYYTPVYRYYTPVYRPNYHHNRCYRGNGHKHRHH